MKGNLFVKLKIFVHILAVSNHLPAPQIYCHKLVQNIYLFGHCFAFITKPFPIWNIIFFQGRITGKQKTSINKYVQTWMIITFVLCGSCYTSITCHHWYNSAYVRNFQNEKIDNGKASHLTPLCDLYWLQKPHLTKLGEDILRMWLIQDDKTSDLLKNDFEGTRAWYRECRNRWSEDKQDHVSLN